jgi:hypothetical protein
MTFLLAEVTAAKSLVARLVAVWNRVLTGLPRYRRDRLQRRLPAWAMGDNVRGKRTVGGKLVLRMTRFLAGVVATVERSLASVAARIGSFEPAGVEIILVRFLLELHVVERLQYVVALIARNLSLFFSAVAGRYHRNLARATQAGMAFP